MNREARRRNRPARRKRTIAGLTFLTAASFATVYGQILRAPGAYASPISCQVNDHGDTAGSSSSRTLRYCVTTLQANTGGGTITFDSTFTTSGVALTSTLPYISEPTTIDGGAGVTISASNTTTNFLELYSGASITLSSLSIEDFTFNAPISATAPGTSIDISDCTFDGNEQIIDAQNSTITISNSTVTHNDDYIFRTQGGSFTVTNSTFNHNTGYLFYMDGGTFSLSNSTLSNNGAPGSLVDSIVYMDGGGSVTVTGSTFNANFSDVSGLYVNGSLTVTNSTFTGNYNDNDGGGAIYKNDDSADLTVTNSRFDGNTTVGNGGAILVNGADDVEISTSTFTTNQADVDNGDPNDSGGAIYVYDAGSVTLANTYIGGNIAPRGGAISLRDLSSTYRVGSVTLNFVTVTGNSSAAGGDLLFYPTTPPTTTSLTVNASVLASTGSACSLNGATVTDQYAVATDTSCGFTDPTSVQSATSGELDLASAATQAVSGVTQKFRSPNAASILVTGAPSSALSTGISADQVGTTRSGKYTIGSRQFTGSGPAPGPGPAPAPAPTPTPEPTPTATPSPSASTATTASLDPVTNSDNVNVPNGGVPAGSFLLLEGGKPVTVTVQPDAPRNPSGLDIEGDDWRMKLVGRGDSGDPLGLTEQQALILQSLQSTRAGELGRAAIQPVAQASGAGFKADTPVKFYLLPNIAMGELTTDAAGAFSGTIPVPANLSPGTYTLQMNALAPSGVVRSLSIGVIVEKAAKQTAVARANVRFAPLSSTLDETAKAQLRRVAARAKSGSGVVRSAIVGFVQPTASTVNDKSLSTARAQAVAAYLKSLGVKGVYGVRGEGKAATLGDKARSVDVAITYRR